jgi:hypothetical protein
LGRLTYSGCGSRQVGRGATPPDAPIKAASTRPDTEFSFEANALSRLSRVAVFIRPLNVLSISLAVLGQNKPLELRDALGKPASWNEARSLILSETRSTKKERTRTACVHRTRDLPGSLNADYRNDRTATTRGALSLMITIGISNRIL